MKRLRTRYETAFALTATFLATGALFAFSRLGTASRASDVLPPWRIAGVAFADGAPAEEFGGARAIAPTEADYRRFAVEDSAWRRQDARLPDLVALKRRAMSERVYVLNRAGRRGAAIGVLSQWTTGHPRDREALLWLARLFREAGRTDESIATYRQVLSLSEGER